jgi:DNA-binding transcriptional MerR regulator
MSSQLLISETADLLGLTPKALRHYEKLGLITPMRSGNGYRLYSANHVLRLLRIRRLQSLGLSLTQIKTLLDEKDDTQVWQTILTILLERVKAQIDALEQRREELEDLLADDDTDILAVTEKLPSHLQPAQEYLDRYLTGPQASLWAKEKQLDALLASSALDGYLAILSHWLVEPPVDVDARRVAPVHHSSVRLTGVMGQSGLAREEDQQ